MRTRLLIAVPLRGITSISSWRQGWRDRGADRRVAAPALEARGARARSEGPRHAPARHRRSCRVPGAGVEPALRATWDEEDPWTREPRTWLLRLGWQRAGGLISTLEAPPLTPHAVVGTYRPFGRVLFDGMRERRVPVLAPREQAALRRRVRTSRR